MNHSNLQNFSSKNKIRKNHLNSNTDLYAAKDESINTMESNELTILLNVSSHTTEAGRCSNTDVIDELNKIMIADYEDDKTADLAANSARKTSLPINIKSSIKIRERSISSPHISPNLHLISASEKNQVKSPEKFTIFDKMRQLTRNIYSDTTMIFGELPQPKKCRRRQSFGHNSDFVKTS